jgi:heptaprenylglyceryl phosphate synthase
MRFGYLSVLNSTNTYYINWRQAIGSRMVKAYNVRSDSAGVYHHPVPGGTASGFISQVNAVPYDKPEAAARSHALACSIYGDCDFGILEGGAVWSGSTPITHTMVKSSRSLSYMSRRL